MEKLFMNTIVALLLVAAFSLMVRDKTSRSTSVLCSSIVRDIWCSSIRHGIRVLEC